MANLELQKNKLTNSFAVSLAIGKSVAKDVASTGLKFEHGNAQSTKWISWYGV